MSRRLRLRTLARCGLLLQRFARAYGYGSRSSLNSRTFSMAITAWSAKVSRSVICFSENGRTSSTADHVIAPIDTPSGAMACNCGSNADALLVMARASGNSFRRLTRSIVNVKWLVDCRSPGQRDIGSD